MKVFKLTQTRQLEVEVELLVLAPDKKTLEGFREDFDEVLTDYGDSTDHADDYDYVEIKEMPDLDPETVGHPEFLTFGEDPPEYKPEPVDPQQEKLPGIS